MHLFFKTKQNKTKKASVLQCSAFFIVQLLHPYITTGKIIALTMLIYNVVLVSAVQQSDYYTYIFFVIFLSIMLYHKILNIVPCAAQEDTLVGPSYT